MHLNKKVLSYPTDRWIFHRRILEGFLLNKIIIFNMCHAIIFVLNSSRAPIIQPVSALKLVFDGLSLVIGMYVETNSPYLPSLLFSIVLLTWLMFKYLVKPVRRAFLCSDLTLYHPPPEKKVFPTWLLFVCAIIIPLIIVRSFIENIGSD